MKWVDKKIFNFSFPGELGRSVIAYFQEKKDPRSFFSRKERSSIFPSQGEKEPRNRKKRLNSVENRMRFSTEFPGSPRSPENRMRFSGNRRNCRQFWGDERKKKSREEKKIERIQRLL